MTIILNWANEIDVARIIYRVEGSIGLELQSGGVYHGRHSYGFIVESEFDSESKATSNEVIVIVDPDTGEEVNGEN